MESATTLLYLTGNRFKFEVAQRAMQGTDVVLEQTRLALPEIQSNSVQEIAEFSAQWATRQLDQPFLVTDSGFYIDALNGFPGPFIKFINQWFSVEDLLRLMHDKLHRHVAVQDCLVYSRPSEVAISFWGSYQGTIATAPGRSTGTPIERLFIPDGYQTPISEFSHDEQLNYWSKAEIWQAFKKYIADTSATAEVDIEFK